MSYLLNSNSGINQIVVTPTDSSCGGNGEITVDVDAIVGSITYSITGNSTNYTETTTTNNQTYTFTNLSADTYTVQVVTASVCEYEESVVINDDEKYTISTSTSSTTCGQSNGSVVITVSSGTTAIQLPLSYNVSRISDGVVVYNNIQSYNTNNIFNKKLPSI